MTATAMDEVHVVSAFVPMFWTLAGICLVLCACSVHYAKTYATSAAFLLTPFICWSLLFDNVIMATTGIDRRRTSTQAMLAFHACIMPMLLLVCYELAYVVHKHKGVTFCGITFDTGRDSSCNSADTVGICRWRLSTCLRCIVWIVSCVLLGLNLLGAYHWTSNLSPEITSLYELHGDKTAHVVSAILPALVLVILALGSGLQLWNYGTNYSYRVHASCFNPWIWMFVGAVALLVGYLMPSPIYALSSNAGEVIMMATIVRMFREVHYDMQQGLQFGEFIDPEGAAARRHKVQSFDVRSSRLSTSKKSASQSKTAVDQPHGYFAAATPKASELPATFANQLRRGDFEGDARSSGCAACLSVVMPRERTNPLWE